MKIKRIFIYRAAQPYVGGEYRWGAGNAISIAQTTVVVIDTDTDTGVSGCGDYNTVSTGRPGPKTANGRLFAPDTPGLGVDPDFESLGAPVAVYE